MNAIEDLKKSYKDKIGFRCLNCGFSHIFVGCKDYKSAPLAKKEVESAVKSEATTLDYSDPHGERQEEFCN